MKRNILVFVILIILFGHSSCSKDESNSADNSGDVTLVKTIVYSDYPFMQQYTYDGTKLKKLKTDTSGHTGYGNGYYLTFTYTGDLITKIESYDSNDALNAYVDIKYSNGRILEAKTYAAKLLKAKYEYTFNSDGSVDENVTSYFDSSKGNVFDSTRLFFDSTGNLIKTTNTDNSSTVYTYDEKNNPLKNITGLREALCLRDLEYAQNNVITMVDYNGTIQSFKTLRNYQYNAEGFPLSCVISANGKSSSTINYYY